MPQHLLGIKDLSHSDIVSILQRSSFFFQVGSPMNPLSGRHIINCFFENSTRTKLSFELAQSKVGVKFHNFDTSKSSITKGETLIDTLKTFESMGFHAAVIRHSENDLFESIKASDLGISVINAGSGTSEHPTQALLDLFTMQQEFGDLEGRTISIIGDIKHSRVARSNMIALDKLGARVKLSGPKALMLDSKELPTCAKNVEIDEAFCDTDVVMMLRMQSERHNLSFDNTNYLQDYGLNAQRARQLNPKTIIMHPGPFNREKEIDSSLINHPQSRIWRQVRNGTIVRMAILDWIFK